MKFNQSKLLNSFTNITHAFTTKASGNLAFHVNDRYENVLKNHELLASTLKYKKQTLIHMKQIHSNIVHIVDENDNFDNPPTCDALITDRLNTPLMVMVADCSPILFYDSKLHIIAVAHAGREGAFKNIIQNVISTFKETYNSSTNDIYVSIGASICKNCYKISDKLYKEAKKLNLDFAITIKQNSYYLDISKILKKQLLNSKIDKNKIEISNECTCCNNDKYFSYRANNTTGRVCGVISLKT